MDRSCCGLVVTDVPAEHVRRRGKVSPPMPLLGAVVALVAVTLGSASLRAASPTAEREVIAAYLEAWYGGDYEGAMRLRAPQPLRTGPPEERARAEVSYQAALGAEVELGDCEPLPPRTRRCRVAYGNVLNDAVGQAPAAVMLQFGIVGGRIQFVAGPYLEDLRLVSSFRRYALAFHADGYSSSCRDAPGYQPVACAHFTLEVVDDWAEWHRIEAER